MKQQIFTVRDNQQLTRDVFRLTLSGDPSAITAPGQFINIKLSGLYLRRPISVCDVSDDGPVVVYKIVGQGTRQLSGLAAGAELDVLSGLGNGFDVSRSGARPLLVGGGVGTPPLYYLAKCLLRQGVRPTLAVGFNTAAERFLLDDFAALGVPLLEATLDGTAGTAGYVTDAIAAAGGQWSYVYACGPEPMLKAVYGSCDVDGQFSFEQRMGCGFGACMGCSCETKYGAKRICQDGPVLERGEIIW